jgi:hypothetical protein
MTGFVSNFPVIGTQPEASFFTPDTTQRQPIGFTVDATDKYWGPGRLMYAKASEALTLGNIVYFNNSNEAVKVPNTANTGLPYAIALTDMAINTYGWFMLSGRYVINSTASVAAGTAIGVVAAGQGGAVANGKQLLSTRVVAPATTTLAKTANARSGSKILTLQNADADGWFIGMPLTGTGMGASAKVTSISPDGRTVTVDVATTAAINGGTITGTFNDATIYWNIVQINSPFVQGQIA